MAAGSNQTIYRLTPDDLMRLNLDFFTPEMDLIEYLPGNPDDNLGTLRIRSLFCGLSEYSVVFTPKKVLTMNLIDRDAGCGYLPKNLKDYLDRNNTAPFAAILSAYDSPPYPPKANDFDLTTPSGVISWQIRLFQHYRTPIALMKGAIPDLTIDGAFRQTVVADLAREISVTEDPKPYAFSLSDQSTEALIGRWQGYLQSDVGGERPTHEDLVWLDSFMDGVTKMGDEKWVAITAGSQGKFLAFRSQVQEILAPIEPLHASNAGPAPPSHEDLPPPPLPPAVLEPVPDLQIAEKAPEPATRTFPWFSGFSPALGGVACVALAAGLREGNSTTSHALASGGAALTGFGLNELGNYLFPGTWWSDEAGKIGSVGVGLLAGAAGFGLGLSFAPDGSGPVVVTEPKPVAKGSDSAEGQRGGRGRP